MTATNNEIKTMDAKSLGQNFWMNAHKTEYKGIFNADKLFTLE